MISDGVQFPVSEKQSAREAYLAFGLSLRDDPRVGSVEFDFGRSLLMTAESPAALFELAAALPEMLGPLPTEVTDLELSSSDGAISLEGAPGPWLMYAERVWAGAARYGATGLQATPELVELRVQREQDVEDARFRGSSQLRVWWAARRCLGRGRGLPRMGVLTLPTGKTSTCLTLHSPALT